MTLSEYPGFASFAPDFQAMLTRIEAGDDAERQALLERVAEALSVFIGLDLLQFVFVTNSEPEPTGTNGEPEPIDLIAPSEEPAEAIAWFSVDEAGYDGPIEVEIFNRILWDSDPDQVLRQMIDRFTTLV